MVGRLQTEIKIQYPAAGNQGLIHINLDQNLFHHQSDIERWKHLQSVFVQEGVCSVLTKKPVHAKFTYRDQQSGEYCQPVFEICGRESELNWEVFIREVLPEVAEELFDKSQNVNQKQKIASINQF